MNIVSYLIEAHIFIRENSGLKFLLLKRSSEEIYPKLWQMVTGRINSNEKAFEAAKREIVEETGLKPLKMWVVPRVNSFYSQEKDEICMVPVFATEVGNTEVKLSEEHTEYVWCDAGKAKELLAWEGQRKAVDLIVEYFTKPRSELKFIEIK
ncbi:MAG: NUDIX pyrophosphatase [Ignavibacteria bacterium]|nr:MAG: NUDIX pyrophosphatase [Ignavibacteria bacterium]